MAFRTVDQIKELMTKTQVAIEKVMLGQEYTFDTGMTVQKVKRADLGMLQKFMESLDSELSVAELKANNCQITRGISC